MNYYGQKIMTGSVVMTGSQVDQSHTRGTISEFMGHHRVLFFRIFISKFLQTYNQKGIQAEYKSFWNILVHRTDCRTDKRTDLGHRTD